MLFPKIQSSIPETLYVPVPRIRFSVRVVCESLAKSSRRNPLNVVIQWKAYQYHLHKVDLSEERYQNDVYEAIRLLYSNYRYYPWRPFAFRRIIGVEYVKVVHSYVDRALVSS